MTTFDYTGREFDTEQLSAADDSIKQIEGDGSDSLALFVKFLVTNSPGLSENDLDALYKLVWPRMTKDPSGNYASVAEAIQPFKDQMSSDHLDKVVKTIREAEAIDANAEYISARGSQAQNGVLHVTGSRPSSGFNGEGADAIRSRAQVLLSVWAKCADDDNKKLIFFKDGFGNDPCLAARLDGVQAFAAQLEGISADALSELKVKNEGLLATVNNLYESWKPEDDADQDSADKFREWLDANHSAVVGNPEFGDIWQAVKDVNMLT